MKNGMEKRIFRLEVLMYVMLGKMAIIPNYSVQDFIITVWRTLF